MHPRDSCVYLSFSVEINGTDLLTTSDESARLVKGATGLIESQISVLFFVHFYYMLNKSIFIYYFSQFITRLRCIM